MRLSLEVDVDTPLSELSAIGRETRSVRRFYSDSVIDGTLNLLFAAVRWSEWKRDQAKIGFALVRLLPHGRAEHRSCEGRAALTCRSRLLRHTPEPCARRPSPSASLLKLFQSCGRDETLYLTCCNVRTLEPLVESLLHSRGHRDRAGMPCLSLQIDNGPVLLTLLNVAEIQFHCLRHRMPHASKHGQRCSIPFFVQALTIWCLPQSLRLFGGEPVS